MLAALLCYTARMGAPFTIDPASGSLRFPDLNLELIPGMTEDDFLAATKRLNRDNLGFNDGWQRYSIREPIPEDQKLGMFLVFFNERLNKLGFSWCGKDETWDNWTEARDLAWKKAYQQALDSELGGRTQFPWGRASVIEDNKGGGTEIWIDYSPPA